MFQQDVTSADQHATLSLSWSERERDARNASSSRRLCPCTRPCTGHISSTNSDNFELICHDN